MGEAKRDKKKSPLFQIYQGHFVHVLHSDSDSFVRGIHVHTSSDAVCLLNQNSNLDLLDLNVSSCTD